MKNVFSALLCLAFFSGSAQKAITNEISGELRGGIGLTASKLYEDSLNLRYLSFPSASLIYTPSIGKRTELHLGLSVDAKGGKSDSPIAKYRSYNVSALIGFRQKLNDFKIGIGVHPTYFLDTQKTILEGSLKSGTVHFSIPHFLRYDLPAYLSMEVKLHERVNFEFRPSVSLPVFEEDVYFLSLNFSANFLLAERYKRERVNK